ncbi:MAG: bifunctional diaminohydroxyphosphoribosylaminopyrimidine deaminase/5-amino-6-(5-phosphoribosylamino)uracil reductase RibD [Deltaproteobacteria bacterium]|nr:bifunctional diaminohydroxyphosphoribosylaminopyrimidine deaminase/5-amino-6-(5-phosphoribosylamino)uracil reductase RibD [Deltaproteobacteria bacterium]
MIPPEYYIKTAINLAKKGRGYTSPNPVVGAVVVKNNKIIGKGFHEAYGKPHAEANALNNAGKASFGADLYVTLEPCNHYGKTPPCTKKIIEAGIKRVFIAASDPNPNVAGSGADFLRKNNIEIITGICENKAKQLNESFIKYITAKKPFVTVKCASTLDGQTASSTGDSKWITSEKSREYVHLLRHYNDAIMVGINTVKKDNPSLTARINGINTKDPQRFILDTKLSIDEKSKVITQKSNATAFIVTGGNISFQKKKRLENNNNVKVIIAPLTNTGKIDLKALMKILGDMKIASLFIEGGGKVIASAFSSGIADKVCFFYAPKILGGNNGSPICYGKGALLVEKSLPVKNIEFKRFENDIFITGYV